MAVSSLVWRLGLRPAEDFELAKCCIVAAQRAFSNIIKIAG